MNKRFITQMKKNLELEKKSLLFKINRDKEFDIDMSGDEIDTIQGNVLLSIGTSLNDKNIDNLNKVIIALEKIDANEYGLCDDCGDEIPEKRLAINPYFLTCVACAEEREGAK